MEEGKFLPVGEGGSFRLAPVLLRTVELTGVGMTGVSFAS